MDKKEALRIYTLSKNTKLMLKDPIAIQQLRQYVDGRELGEDSRLLNSINIYAWCEILLQEEERALTDNEMLELCGMGIPLKERKELKESVGGSRSNSNTVIKKIQEGCANKLSLSPEYEEFVSYIYLQAK